MNPGSRIWTLVLVLSSAAFSCGPYVVEQESIEWYESGRQYFEASDFDSARVHLSHAISIDPKNHRAAYLIGEMEFRLRRFDSAASFFLKSLRGKKAAKTYLRLSQCCTQPDENDHVSTLSAQHAIKYAKKALLYDEDDPTIYYQLGYAYSFLGDALAEKMYVRVLELDSNFVDASAELVQLYEKGAEFEELFRYYERLCSRPAYQDSLRPFLARSYLLADHKVDLAYLYLVDKLSDLDHPSLFRVLFNDITDITSDEEKKAYEAAPNKGLFLHKFWKSRDPTPLTSKNERLEEHYRRIAFAVNRFRSFRMRGLFGGKKDALPYDVRGRFFVRYGPPDDAYIDHLGSFGKSYGGTILEEGSESWLYHNIAGRKLLLDFLETNGVYNFGASLGSGLTGRRISAGARISLDPIYGRLSRGTLSYIGYQSIQDGVLEKSPIDQFQYDYNNRKILDFSSERYVYKNNDVMLYYGLNYSGPDDGTNFVRTAVAVFDSNWNQFLVQTTQQSPVIEADGAFLDLEKLNLPDGQYHVYLQLEDSTSNAIGVFRHDVQTGIFRQDTLQVTPLLPARRLTPSGAPSKFAYNGFEIMPNLGSVFQRTQPMGLYFEIYNLLLNNRGENSYSIEYRVRFVQSNWQAFLGSLKTLVGVDDHEKTVSNTAIFSSPNRDEPVGNSIDLSSYPEGSYELEVIVTDNISGETVTRKLPFEIAG